MRLILSMIALFFFLGSNAQNKKYNTHIDTAGSVEIKGGTTTILKADTVIINQTIRTKVYYWESISEKDTSGLYTTSYLFAPRPPNNPGVFLVNIRMRFNKPLLPDHNGMLFSIPDAAVVQGQYGVDPDSSGLTLHGQITGNTLTIVVKSKMPLFATIYGVDGRIGQ